MAERLFSGFLGRFERLEMWQSDFDVGCERLESRVSSIRLLDRDRKKVTNA